jgi:hypothetical protein
MPLIIRDIADPAFLTLLDQNKANGGGAAVEAKALLDIALFTRFTTRRGVTKSVKPERVIPRELMDTLCKDFGEHVRLNEDEQLGNHRFEVEWSDFAKQITTTAKQPGDKLGVKFVYGVQNDDLVLFMKPVILTPATLPKYTITESGKVFKHSAANKRFDECVDATECNTAQGKYYTDMLIWRTGTQRQYENLVDPSHSDSSDPGAVILPWEFEIAEVFDHNYDPGKDDERCFRLVIACISGKTELPSRPLEFRHSLAVFMRLGRFGQNGKTTDHIDQLMDGDAVSIPTKIFRGRGADLGNLCPPSCPEYTYQP